MRGGREGAERISGHRALGVLVVFYAPVISRRADARWINPPKSRPGESRDPLLRATSG